MTDFSWLQYVGNPYAVFAIIAAVLGITFKSILKNNINISAKNPGLLVAMYAMFLICVTSLGLGVIGINFIMQGRGASDSVMVEEPVAEVAMAPRAAKAPAAPSNITEEYQEVALTGWIWAGKVVAQPDSEAKNPVIKIEDRTINKAKLGKKTLSVKNITQTNLRASQPKWTLLSWFSMSYKLGELVETIKPNKTLQILEKEIIGNQLWLKVEVK